MPRLKRVSRDDLTIARRRQGRGFVFLDKDGNAVCDSSLLARARHLAIPPAWQEVRIAEHERAHIQACGLDAGGRVQYIYHPDWEERRTKRKLGQLSLLSQALPRIRRHVREDLGAEAGSKTLALALGVALIDTTAMRVGRERYLDSNGTRGAGTLFTRDVRLSDDQVRIKFPAKSGKTAEYQIADPRLVEAVQRILTIPGKRLLMYRDAEGKPKALRTEQLNAYLRELAGAPITAKDFRTLHASALAGEALAKLEPATSVTGRNRQITAVTRQVAAFLQNTPAICRKSYVAPCLFTLFEKGRLADLWAASVADQAGLKRREARLALALAAV